jgi:hypothetical protein
VTKGILFRHTLSRSIIDYRLLVSLVTSTWRNALKMTEVGCVWEIEAMPALPGTNHDKKLEEESPTRRSGLFLLIIRFGVHTLNAVRWNLARSIYIAWILSGHLFTGFSAFSARPTMLKIWASTFIINSAPIFCLETSSLSFKPINSVWLPPSSSAVSCCLLSLF